MGFSRSFTRPKRGGDSQVHINMAPMIDFLVITIAYLLISASFYTVGVVDSTVDSTNGSAIADKGERNVIEVKIQNDHSIQFMDSQGGITETLMGAGEESASEQLVKRLTERIGGSTAVRSIILNSDSNISYGEMVTLMNKIRPIAPLVSLSVDAP